MGISAVIGGILLVGGFLAMGLGHRSIRVEWRKTAKALDLDFGDAGPLDERHTISGAIDGVRVSVYIHERSDGDDGKRRTAVFLVGLEPALDLDARGRDFGRSVKRLFVPADVRTGDADFDKHVQLSGNAPSISAAMTQSAREVLLDYVRRGGSVRDGVVAHSEPWKASSSRATTTRILDMVAVAETLSLGGRSVPEALAHNVGTEADAQVRRRNLDLLLDDYPGHAATRGAGQQAANDPDADVRLLAAIALGPEGGPAVIEGLRGAEASAESIRRAVRWLATRGRSTAVEDVLLQLLNHSDGAVKLEAAVALGAVGTLAAVESLLAVTETLLAGADLKRAAQLSIATIQSGLKDAEAGRLTVIQPAGDEGALSINGGSGHLSATPPES